MLIPVLVHPTTDGSDCMVSTSYSHGQSDYNKCNFIISTMVSCRRTLPVHDQRSRILPVHNGESIVLPVHEDNCLTMHDCLVRKSA